MMWRRWYSFASLVEIQYLRTITDDQRREFSDLVHLTIQQIESAQFLLHSGIRFPRIRAAPVPMWGCAWVNQN